MANGLDPSWCYALNKITGWKNVKFGHDVVYTYGPLGFLCSPMYINGNLLFSAFFYLFLWISLLVMFHSVVKKNEKNVSVIAASIFVLFLSHPVYSADIYIQYCVLFALCSLWLDSKNTYSLIFLIISSTVSFFFKFSIAVSVLGMLVLFLISKICRKDFCRIWGLFVPFAAIPACYFVYNPSVKDFFSFVKGSWEISKGYCFAMSTDGILTVMIFPVAALMLIYAALMILHLRFKSAENFFVLLWLSPCFFMSYKHGFVRSDGGHTMLSIREMLCEFSVLILLFDFKTCKNIVVKTKTGERAKKNLSSVYDEIVSKTKKGIMKFGVASIFVSALILGFGEMNKLLYSARYFPLMIYAMTGRKYQNNLKILQTVPPQFVEKIGNKSFTNYSWEITFIEPMGKKADNYVVLPALQMFSAYTSYLDEKSAGLFSEKNPPEYLMLRLEAIDGRIPLLEAPATWNAIQKNYVFSAYDDSTEYFLLKHEKKSARLLQNAEILECTKKDEISLEGFDEAKIHAKLSIFGKIVNLFWKIPEVCAKITYSDGTVKTGRVIMDNLQNGIPLKNLPRDLESFGNSVSGKKIDSAVKIEFFGSGLKFYSNKIRTELIRLD
jgi:hypothetical protein